jgi:hypothetical protein
VAFANDLIEDHVRGAIEAGAPGVQAAPVELSYADLVHMSRTLRLPFVVVTSAACDLDDRGREYFEVFYKQNHLASADEVPHTPAH